MMRAEYQDTGSLRGVSDITLVGLEVRYDRREGNQTIGKLTFVLPRMMLPSEFHERLERQWREVARSPIETESYKGKYITPELYGFDVSFRVDGLLTTVGMIDKLHRCGFSAPPSEWTHEPQSGRPPGGEPSPFVHLYSESAVRADMTIADAPVITMLSMNDQVGGMHFRLPGGWNGAQPGGEEQFRSYLSGFAERMKDVITLQGTPAATRSGDVWYSAFTVAPGVTHLLAPDLLAQCHERGFGAPPSQWRSLSGSPQEIRSRG